MDKKRTIEDVQKDIEKLYKKTMEKKNEFYLAREAIDFKIQILDKIYLEEEAKLKEEHDMLKQEHDKSIEDEVRKELGL